MRNVIIAENTYQLPEGLNELSFDKYIAINNLVGQNEIETFVNIFSILTGIDREVVDTLDVNTLFTIDFHWLFVQHKYEIKYEFILNDESFKLKSDFNNLSVKEYNHINDVVKDINTYDKLIAILLRKEDEKYDSDRVNERAELVRKYMMADDVIKIVTFFLTGEKGLIQTLLTYYQKVLKMKMKTDGE